MKVYGYVRQEIGQTVEGLERVKQWIEETYEDSIREGQHEWCGFFCDDLRTARFPLDERPEGLKLLELVEIEDEDGQNAADSLIIVCSLSHFGPTFRHIFEVLEHLHTWDVDVLVLGKRRFISDNDHGRHIRKLMELVASMDADLAETEREAPQPPKKPAPLTPKQKQQFAEHGGAELLIKKLYLEGKSAMDIWRRLLSDGYKNAQGREWSRNAIRKICRAAKSKQAAKQTRASTT